MRGQQATWDLDGRGDQHSDTPSAIACSTAVSRVASVPGWLSGFVPALRSTLAPASAFARGCVVARQSRYRPLVVFRRAVGRPRHPAGGTRLVNLLCHAHSPNAGKVMIAGISWSSIDEDDGRNMHCGPLAATARRRRPPRLHRVSCL